MRKMLLVSVFVLILFPETKSQELGVHPRSEIYEWPDDKKVLEKLDDWQDRKFGIIIHWGLYAVPGIIESWGLCSEDWIERPDSLSYHEFKQWYWGLKDRFNPVDFDPEQWAQAAADAGMKYIVFTTKHHDGFNLFDTGQTDFKITSGPFAGHPKANIAKHVFEAFREKDFMIGAYFSKPDWHSPYFWWDKYATPNRNVNYDIRKYPDRWAKFKDFTFKQINELMSDYGAIDILWLDGGWVRPRETVNEEVLSWGAPIPEWDQQVDMPGIAEMARKMQPGLIIVDRTVHGPYENYQTPERSIPSEQLSYPWESCITLGNNWGYVPGDQLKTSTQVIHDLIEIVAKGGSLLLGVGPNPQGTLDSLAVSRLKEIGLWMKDNGAAIYGTRVTACYQSGEVFFTKDKKGICYALARLKEKEPVPEWVEWTGNLPADNTLMTFLPTGERVRWKKEQSRVMVSIPRSFRQKHQDGYPALVFAFSE